MNTIGMAVVFAILLVTANAMMMSAARADPEAGRAQDDRLHATGGSSRSIMLEAAAHRAHRCGASGSARRSCSTSATDFNAAGFLPGFDVTRATLLVGAVVALLLMLASGIVPARAGRAAARGARR